MHDDARALSQFIEQGRDELGHSVTDGGRRSQRQMREEPLLESIVWPERFDAVMPAARATVALGQFASRRSDGRIDQAGANPVTNSSGQVDLSNYVPVAGLINISMVSFQVLIDVRPASGRRQNAGSLHGIRRQTSPVVRLLPANLGSDTS